MNPIPGKPGVVALLTDFGMQDDYVGQMHAAILSVDPEIRIIDLCHAVPAGNVRAAAFLLRHDLETLPEGSVVAVVVDPGVGTDRALLVAQIGSRFLVAPDNGVIAPLIDDGRAGQVRRLENRGWGRLNPSNTFHGRDIIGPAAARIASGESIEESGPMLDRWETLTIQPVEQDGVVTGEVLWVDRFGNLVTNLEAELEVNAIVTIGSQELRRVFTFAEAEQGETVWLVGSRGTIEIVRKGQSAADVLGIGWGAAVQRLDNRHGGTSGR